MKKLLFSIITMGMLISTVLISAELIPIWHTVSGAGDIQDIEFLKGHNQFILLVGVGSNAQLQLRSTETGELINSVPTSTSIESRIVITPDSTRFIHLDGGGAHIRKIDENFSKEGLLFFNSDSIVYRFTDIAIDPIRPLVYVTIFGQKGTHPNITTKSKVSVYNYETREFIKDLTEMGDYKYSVIEVSDDGKYLATLNDGKAYLKVWDLETMVLIVDEKLYVDNQEFQCQSKDIRFSKLTDNRIFISGLFSMQAMGKRHSGVFTFDMINSERVRIVPEAIYSGNLIHLLDNETRIFNSNYIRVGVLDLISEELEWYGKPPQFIFTDKVIYSKYLNSFIGITGDNISKFLYDSQSSIEYNIEEDIVISPNPTNGYFNINFTNKHPSAFKYEVISNSGQIVQSGVLGYLNLDANFINMDISTVSNGQYLLRVYSEQEEFVFNVIKED